MASVQSYMHKQWNNIFFQTEMVLYQQATVTLQCNSEFDSLIIVVPPASAALVPE